MKKFRHKFSRKFTLLALGTVATAGVLAADGPAPGTLPGGEALKAGFQSPPPEARPRVWWHWMNGNVTRDGIAKDLEWMARIGIGGVQNFDAAMETPIIVDKRLVYMSPEWQQAFRFAVEKADSLGLEFTITSSPGWSETGGPWVTPDDAMKKLVWSEQLVTGGGPIDITLPRPPAVPGPFQDIPAVYKHGHNPDAVPQQYYRDALVLAYPLADTALLDPPVSITANGELIDSAVLADADLNSGVPLPAATGSEAGVIELTFPALQTVRSATLFIANYQASPLSRPLAPELQVRQEGGEWLPVTRFEPGKVPTTVSFAEVSGDQFRLVFASSKPSSSFNFSPASGLDPSGLGSLVSGSGEPPRLTEFSLTGQARIDNYEKKAGFELVANYHELRSQIDDNAAAINPDSVLDLSANMDAEGRLQWQAPAGSWKVLRLGYSLTGKTNSPATAEATGLEVDKYDAPAVERYLSHYLDMYRAVVGDSLLGERGLQGLLTDSIEAGPSNWTPTLRKQFAERRGYDPIPWLPALTGEIVGSRAQSEGFLYDFRDTLAELIADNHYGTVGRLARDNGLTVYGESLESNRDVSTLGDDLEMRRFADIPMAAMWTYASNGTPADRYVADMRGAASVAHLYGKPLVAAESLTSILRPWAHTPADLQPMIDAEFIHGVNRPVIHTSVHQPIDERQPGLSLHVFGQFFNRHESWAELAAPWVTYLARNSFMLQQGKNVADVAYFYGEEPPLGVLANTDGYPADVPLSYAYDFVSPHALLHELKVTGNDLVTAGGARYRLLYLGKAARQFMTLPVLRRLENLVAEGATLVGTPPLQSPSLADDPARFAALVDRLWSGAELTPIGKGRVIASENVEQALELMNIAPDFAVDGAAPVAFVHRRLADGDVYYLANRGEAQAFSAQFRVTGRAPEIWRADTGSTEAATYRIEDGHTTVTLRMGEHESFFVVFRQPAAAPSQSVAPPVLAPLARVEGPWQVSFQEGRGAPERVILAELASLSEHDDEGIRYFSGVATYTTTFSLTRSPQTLLLDLGEVGDVAEVLVNGRLAGTAWKPPYRVDIADLVQPGENELGIRVANLWVNRLIGDRQRGAEPVAYTTFKTYLPSAPLRRSGLMGPVTLLQAREE